MSVPTSDPQIVEPQPPAPSPATDSEDLRRSKLAEAATAQVTAQSSREYLRALVMRLRSGDSGLLPIIGGLALIVIFFQVERAEFLSAGNLTDLLVQSSVFIMFGLAEVFVLIMSEIDLSVGYTAAVGGFTIAELVAPPINAPWWAGILGGLAVTSCIGLLQGTLVARLKLPSFIVTLAGSLAFEGVMLELSSIDKTAVGGVMTIDSSSPIYKLCGAQMSPALGWVMLVAAVVVFAVTRLARARRKRLDNVRVTPPGITLMTIALTALAGVAVVSICNTNRGNLLPLRGVPWVVPFVLLVVAGWSWLLGRTKFGREVYAIGNNPEAARRAGINVSRVKTLGFMLCSFTAGIAGLVAASQLGSTSTDVDGGVQVLYGVAAAVIGGTSLYGGRGRPLAALIGGIVIATVFNGLGLMGVSTAVQDISTAFILILAVTVDSVGRQHYAPNKM